MQLVKTFVFMLKLLDSSTAGYFCHHHYKSVCRSSNATIVFEKCRTIPISRYQGTLSLAGYIVRDINKALTTIEVAYKPPGGQNFRTIINLKNIEPCGVLRNPLLIKWNIATECKELYPQYCHECPYKSGERFNFNFTKVVQKCPSKNGQRKPTLEVGFWWPDGEYRYSVSSVVDGDPEPITFQYFFREKNGGIGEF